MFVSQPLFCSCSLNSFPFVLATVFLILPSVQAFFECESATDNLTCWIWPTDCGTLKTLVTCTVISDPPRQSLKFNHSRRSAVLLKFSCLWNCFCSLENLPFELWCSMFNVNIRPTPPIFRQAAAKAGTMVEGTRVKRQWIWLLEMML